MIPASDRAQVPIPPPSYQRVMRTSLHLDALTLVTRLHLLALCRLALCLSQRWCPPPLPAGPGGRPRVYRDESLLLVALLRTLWRLSYDEVRDWLRDWPALALACGLPLGLMGQPQIPSKGQLSKRWQRAGAPPCETLLVLLVRLALQVRLTRARDLIIDSAPILAWRRADPDAGVGHAPAHYPRPLLRGYRVHTLLCRSTGLPLLFHVSPANVHDVPFARPLLAMALRLYRLHPYVIRLDAGYWGLRLIVWIHTVLGAVVIMPWNPKRQRSRPCLPPTWTAEELGKRTSIERFFGRVFCFFRLQRPPLCGWTAITRQVALTYAATWVIALAAYQSARPDLIRSPTRVLAHLWEGL